MQIGDNEKIKVSVIVPVYNVAKYLVKCLDTIVNQTLKDIEVICIDDCSKDESFSILQQFARKDSRVNVVRNSKNLGAGLTRNIGIKMAKGEYLSILDGDDYFELDMLEKMYKRCKMTNSDIAICDIYWRNEIKKEEKRFEHFSDAFSKTNKPFSILDVPNNIFTTILEVPFNKMYKREFVYSNGLNFQDLPNSNDVYFGQITMALAKSIVYVPKTFVHYRYNRPDQISSNRKKYPYCGYKAALRLQEELKKRNLFDVCRRSFFTYIVWVAKCSIWAAAENKKDEVRTFWKGDGFSSFAMNYCNGNSFSDEGSYNSYCDIMNYRKLDNIKVSIIIPVYNAEKYIRDCIESVQRQTINEIEIICIDDGSTDQSSKIIRQMQTGDERIQYYYQENKGAGSARNQGIRKSQGEYIAFLDSDDLYLEAGALEKIYWAAHNNDARVSACYMKILHGGKLINHPAFNDLHLEYERWIDFDDIQNDYYFTAYIFQRKFLNENDIKFPKLRVYEDPVFLMRALLCEKSIYFIPTYLYVNRVGEHGLDYFGKHILDLMSGLKENLKIAIQNNYQAMKVRLIKRINIDFYDIIRENYSGAVESLMEEIVSMVGCEVVKKELLPRSVKENVCKVSIIVPVYNVEKYLRQCLDSVINQKLRGIEVICVNDGSTDSSLSILEEYAKKDARIKIINKANAGYGQTMNVGLRASRGEYIGIVESDDWIEPDMFEALYTIADNNNKPDIVKSDAFFVERENNRRINRIWNVTSCDKVIELDNYKNIVTAPATTWTAIYKRDVFIKNAVKWNETPGASFQDTSFAIMMIMFSHKAYVINKPFYHYRIDSVGSSTNVGNNGFRIFKEYQYLEQVLGRNVDLKNKYWNVIQIAKFKSYKWAADRVEDKDGFWIKAVKEFEKNILNGGLDESAWPKNEWQNLQALMERYCYDDKDAVFSIGCSCGSEYVFPYHLFKRNSRVLIYGSGNIGKDFYRSAKDSEYVNCVALVDDVIAKTVVDGIDVLPKERLKKMEYDAILIACIDEGGALKIQTELINNGIAKENIYWAGDMYRKNDFLKNFYYKLLDEINV